MPLHRRAVTRVVVEAGTSETKTETWVAETKTETEATKIGLEAGLETEAGSRDLIDKSVTSETKTETEAWAAETKTETEAIKIWSRGRPRDRGRSSRPPSLIGSTSISRVSDPK